MNDKITIRRVANGWVMQTGREITLDEFTHVAFTADQVGRHVHAWALAVEATTEPDVGIKPVKKGD